MKLCDAQHQSRMVKLTQIYAALDVHLRALLEKKSVPFTIKVSGVLKTRMLIVKPEKKIPEMIIYVKEVVRDLSPTFNIQKTTTSVCVSVSTFAIDGFNIDNVFGSGETGVVTNEEPPNSFTEFKEFLFLANVRVGVDIRSPVLMSDMVTVYLQCIAGSKYKVIQTLKKYALGEKIVSNNGTLILRVNIEGFVNNIPGINLRKKKAIESRFNKHHNK